MTASAFRQYPLGPMLPTSLFSVNVENARKYLDDRRHYALRMIGHTSRGEREWNAVQYLERKRDLFFLLNQRAS